MTDERLAVAMRIRDGLAAGAVAAVVSGGPSTAYSAVAGDDVLAATRAAGSIVLPSERDPSRLVLAAIPVHLTLSLGWGLVLALVLPGRKTALWGALAGLGIAALDLGYVGARFERVRSLPLAPQIADHVAFGATAGAVLAYLRRRRRADTL